MKKLFILLVLALPLITIAQEKEISENFDLEKVNPWEGSLMLGLSSYEGDLHCFEDENLGIFTNANFAIGLGLKKNLSKTFAVGLSYRLTKLSANEEDFANAGHVRRGYSFSNSINELTVRADITPFGKKDWKVQPYVYVGFGVALGKSETDFKGSGVDNPSTNPLVNKDMTDVSSATTTAPIGFGLKANITDDITIGLEGGLRFLTNDYLDGVSESGNSDVNDFYGIGGVTVGYTF